MGWRYLTWHFHFIFIFVSPSISNIFPCRYFFKNRIWCLNCTDIYNNTIYRSFCRRPISSRCFKTNIERAKSKWNAKEVCQTVCVSQQPLTYVDGLIVSRPTSRCDWLASRHILIVDFKALFLINWISCCLVCWVMKGGKNEEGRMTFGKSWSRQETSLRAITFHDYLLLKCAIFLKRLTICVEWQCLIALVYILWKLILV